MSISDQQLDMNEPKKQIVHYCRMKRMDDCNCEEEKECKHVNTVFSDPPDSRDGGRLICRDCGKGEQV